MKKIVGLLLVICLAVSFFPVGNTPAMAETNRPGLLYLSNTTEIDGIVYCGSAQSPLKWHMSRPSLGQNWAFSGEEIMLYAPIHNDDLCANNATLTFETADIYTTLRNFFDNSLVNAERYALQSYSVSPAPPKPVSHNSTEPKSLLYWNDMSFRATEDGLRYVQTTVNSKTGQYDTERSISEAHGIIPDFIALEYVFLFASPAVGGKQSGPVGGSCLLPVAPNTTNEWKLTVASSTYDSFQTNTTSDQTVTPYGGTFPFSFSGAFSGSNSYVSVFLYDESNPEGSCYYGHVANNQSSGEVTLRLPDGLVPGNRYSLVIFGELIKEDKASDIASYAQKVYVLQVDDPTEPIAYASTNDPQLGEPITVKLYPEAQGVTYRWYRNNTPISGATGSSYTPTLDDVGTTLKAEIYNPATGKTASASIGNRVKATLKVTLDNMSPKIGDTIHVLCSPAGASVEYNWFKSDSEGITSLNETRDRYKVDSSNIGAQIYVEVTGTDKFSSSGIITSESTAQVIPSCTEGSSQSFTAGKIPASGASFSFNSDIAFFNKAERLVTVTPKGGAAVPLNYGSDYTAKEGSTIITLAPEYLNKLGAGDYTLTVHFMADRKITATAAFSIKAVPAVNPVPDTGDSTQLVAMFTLAAVSALLLLSVVCKAAKKRKAGK